MRGGGGVSNWQDIVSLCSVSNRDTDRGFEKEAFERNMTQIQNQTSKGPLETSVDEWVDNFQQTFFSGQVPLNLILAENPRLSVCSTCTWADGDEGPELPSMKNM